jgi:hypothetical protein
MRETRLAKVWIDPAAQALGAAEIELLKNTQGIDHAIHA